MLVGVVFADEDVPGEQGAVGADRDDVVAAGVVGRGDQARQFDDGRAGLVRRDRGVAEMARDGPVGTDGHPVAEAGHHGGAIGEVPADAPVTGARGAQPAGGPVALDVGDLGRGIGQVDACGHSQEALGAVGAPHVRLGLAGVVALDLDVADDGAVVADASCFAPRVTPGQRQVDRPGPADPPDDRNGDAIAIAAAHDVALPVDRVGRAALLCRQLGQLAVAPHVRHIVRGDERPPHADSRGIHVRDRGEVVEHRHFGGFAAGVQELPRPRAALAGRFGDIRDHGAVVAHAGDTRGPVPLGNRQRRHDARLLHRAIALAGRRGLDRDHRRRGDGPDRDCGRDCPAGLKPSLHSGLHRIKFLVIRWIQFPAANQRFVPSATLSESGGSFQADHRRDTGGTFDRA